MEAGVDSIPSDDTHKSNRQPTVDPIPGEKRGGVLVNILAVANSGVELREQE